MSRQKVTKDAVLVAIAAIRNRGDEPSINKVLEITGGSKSTVAALMREISAEAEPAAKADLPDAVRAAMDKSLEEIWTAAKSAAQQKFDDETRRYLARTRALETDLAEMAAAADAAEEQRERSDKRVADLEAQAVQDAEAGGVLERRVRELEAARLADAEKKAALSEKLDELREQMEIAAVLNADLRNRAETAERDAEAARQQAKMQAELMSHFDARFDTLLRRASGGAVLDADRAKPGRDASTTSGAK